VATSTSASNRTDIARKLAQAAMVEAQSAALHGVLVGCGRRTAADHLEQWLAAVQASLGPPATPTTARP
jgi:hypothetical protein